MLGRLVTVRSADTIVVMDQGRIAEQGTHDELMELGGIYAGLAARQMDAGRDMAPTLPDAVRQLAAEGVSAGPLGHYATASLLFKTNPCSMLHRRPKHRQQSGL